MQRTRNLASAIGAVLALGASFGSVAETVSVEGNDRSIAVALRRSRARERLGHRAAVRSDQRGRRARLRGVRRSKSPRAQRLASLLRGCVGSSASSRTPRRLGRAASIGARTPRDLGQAARLSADRPTFDARKSGSPSERVSTASLWCETTATSAGRCPAEARALPRTRRPGGHAAAATSDSMFEKSFGPLSIDGGLERRIGRDRRAEEECSRGQKDQGQGGNRGGAARLASSA